MRTLRASELGSYLYCSRAWWYASQGISAENQDELAEGSLFHRRHSLRVAGARLLRLLGWMLLLGALLLLTVALTLAVAQ